MTGSQSAAGPPCQFSSSTLSVLRFSHAFCLIVYEKKVVLSTPTAWILILISFVFCFIYAIIMEIVLSCNYKDAEQLQVLLVFITFEVTRMPNYDSITLYKNMQSMMLGELTPEEVLKNTTEYYDSNLK